MIVANFIMLVLSGVGLSKGFSVVGGMSMHLNRAAGGSMQIIYCNHEQAVVAAADGYAKASDYKCPGLAIVTSGPGVTNTTTALVSAFYDSVPMFLISGQVKSCDLNLYGVRSFGPQETPHSELLRPISKLSFVYDPATVSNVQLGQYLALAVTGRKGPVHIDVPLDIQARDVKTYADIAEVLSIYQAILADDHAQSDPLPADLFEALQVAQRPVIVLGNGLKIASVASAEITELVNQLGWPALLTWASMDVIEHHHPLNFGCAGGLAGVHSNRILQSADVIIFLGTRLDLLTTGFKPESYGKNARRFVIDCDPAERSKYAHVQGLVGIPIDVRAAVKALRAFATTQRRDHEAWLSQCCRWRHDNQIAEDRAFQKPRLTSYHVAKLISRASTTRYIVPTASGFAVEGFARFYKAGAGSRFAWAGHVLGSMGLAIPSAIGASARLGKIVACVDGDGGFLFNMQELYTLKANPQLAIAIFVLNNRGYASISMSQQRAFKQNFGADADSGLAPIDFEPLAKIGGLDYIACHSYNELEIAIERIKSDSRVLIDIYLDDDDHYRGPAISTKFDENGVPYSTNLEDIAWR